ncbi:unnamed protein product, partial [Effrenium voratum]
MKVQVALLLPWAASAYVCQVLTQSNESLQDSLDFHCDVSGEVCNCSSSFVQGISWLLVNSAMNATMNYSAKAGEWFLTDASGRCVAAFGETSAPSLQKCPPGFYCLGGLAPPRSCNSGDHCPAGTGDESRACPMGYFCPIPAADVRPCPAGGHCPGGTTEPQACWAGHYCRPGDEGQCPKGHYCPFGTETPKRCKPFFRCPPGSKAPDPWFFCLLILLVIAGLAVLGGHFYPEMVQRGCWTCALVAVGVGLMWLVDEAIALFLSLTFVSVAANWALLRVGFVTPAVAQSLLLCTLCVAVGCLWLVHPPWAAFLGGLLLCCAIGYLMSRQNTASVIIGRFLMLAVFVALSFEYFQVDPQFTIGFGVLMLLLLLGIVVSW